MEESFKKALENIAKYGDTDIFPFPIETHIFFDKNSETLEQLREIHSHFRDRLRQYPPANDGALAPVNYTGFRWATQLDPLWNAYFLGLVISIADQIEAARIPASANRVFSYRYKWDDGKKSLFNENYNWRAFMEHSVRCAKEKKFVVTCDISEFYPRLNHHRLDNALRQLNLSNNTASHVMDFLKNFSDTYSFGLPIGGPAARILSELVLNQIDKLLLAEGIDFYRFADDYHIFCDKQEDAYKSLFYLSEKLLKNQGLQLQKSKTRIMSGQEFVSTSPVKLDEHDTPIERIQDANLQERSQSLLRFSVRFDPYSATPIEDFEALKTELAKYDIVSLLKSELSKSRIHISLSRKIISAIRYIDPAKRDDAVISLISNAELLYPIFSNVLMVARSLFHELSPATQAKISATLRDLLRDGSHVLHVDLNLAYAIRVFACSHSPENEDTLARLYTNKTSPLLRKDIILAMAKWKAWFWLSDLKTRFRTLSDQERRAFIIASYALKDEGEHWRNHIKGELSPFENLVKIWAADKSKLSEWSIPL
jgi:hypothetical protein